jgi:hypothetical protein
MNEEYTLNIPFEKYSASFHDLILENRSKVNNTDHTGGTTWSSSYVGFSILLGSIGVIKVLVEGIVPNFWKKFIDICRNIKENGELFSPDVVFNHEVSNSTFTIVFRTYDVPASSFDLSVKKMNEFSDTLNKRYELIVNLFSSGNFGIDISWNVVNEDWEVLRVTNLNARYQ